MQVHDPWSNKGTGFSLAERDRLRIRGLVPARMLPLDVQAQKIQYVLEAKRDPMEKSA
jgi:malate dehydrogenase (oxaloacetate-decarboxylating)(NADP+)